MKEMLTAVFLLSVMLLSACELPLKWDVEFFKIDEAGFLKGLSVGKNAKKINLSEKAIDLDKIAGGADSAAIRCFIRSGKSRTLWLGVGCRVFSLSLNGKLIYDFRKYGLGNDVKSVSVSDHKIPLELKPGVNEILFNTRRTHWRLDYCYGRNRNISWDLAVKQLEDYIPVKAQLAHPEMALRRDKDSVMFSFVTSEAIPAGVDYRRKGNQKWLREYDTAGDLILREKSRVHRVKINGIENWGDLEYRLVLLEPPAGRDGFKRPLWASRLYKEVYTPVKTLHDPDKKNFSFLLFGDTQLSLSEGCKTTLQRKKLLDKLRTFPEYKQADFLVHVGDMDSVYHNVEDTLLKDLFDGFAPAAGEKLRSWLIVRGNHETNGTAAEDWYNYFQMPEDKSYYTVKLGNVLFIVIDCGDVSKTDPLDAFNGPLLDMKKLFRKQTAWLKKVRQSEEFRNAGFRVVLSHAEPQLSGDMMNTNVRNLTRELLADKSDSGRIHLWIGGHVHRYYRAAAGASDIVARKAVNKLPALAKAPVNWLTCDAPKGDSSLPEFSYIVVNCTPEKLLVKAIDDNGVKFDEFSVDQKGKLTEIYLDKTLKHHPFPDKK